MRYPRSLVAGIFVLCLACAGSRAADATSQRFAEVVALSNAERYAEAIALAGDFLEIQPPEEALAAAALAFRRTGDIPMALLLYRDGQKRYPGQAQFIAGEILTLTDARDYEQAETVVLQHRRYANTGPVADAIAYLTDQRSSAVFSTLRDQAAALARNGWYGQALVMLDQLKELRPETPGILYDRQIILSWAGRHEEALALADRLDLDTTPGYVKQAVAASLRAEGRLEEAEQLYRTLHEEYPDNARIAEGLVMTWLGQNRVDEAEELMHQFNSETASAPMPAAEKMLVTLMQDQAAELSYSDRFSEALALLERVQENYPGHNGIALDIMAIHSWSGHHQEAAAQADRLDLETAPDYVLQAAAMSYREAGKLKKSEQLYRDLLAKHPDNQVLAEGLALTLISACNLDWAGRVIDQYKTGPDTMQTAEAALVHAYQDKAALLAAEGRPDDAVTLLRRVRKERPGSPGVDQDIMSILAHSGRSEEAAFMADRLEAAQAPAPVRLAAAKAYRDVGRLDDAERLYRDVLALEPANTEAAAGLALTLIDTKQLDEAELLIERYHRLDPYLLEPAQQALVSARREQAVQLAHAGQFDTALEMLSPLLRDNPHDSDVLGDYLTVLSLAGRDATAAELGAQLNVEEASERALLAYGTALRNDNRLEQALDVFRRAAIRFPRSPAVAAGLAMTLGDLGRGEEAAIGLDAFADRFPSADMTEIAAARAYLENRPRVQPDALAWNQDGEAEMVRRLRSRLVDSQPASSANYQLKIKLSAAGQHSAWAEESMLSVQRQAELATTQELLDELLSQGEGDIAATAAKIRAFYEMNMLQQAIGCYESIRGMEQHMPANSLLAAAGAYLSSRCPAQAKTLYLCVLARQNDGEPLTEEEIFAAKNGLFWALLENEELDHALAQADTTWSENEHLTEASITRGLAYLYTGFIGLADAHLQDLVARLPDDPDVLSALASVQSKRGLPRSANDLVHTAQEYAPDNLGLTVQEAKNAMDMQDWGKADALRQSVLPALPYHSQVIQLERDWDIHDSYELRLDVSYARVVHGINPVIGTDDAPTVEARLFSRPLAYNWRVFAGAATSAGDFDEGHARQSIYLGGVEYRGPMLTASLEARADTVGDSEFGLQFAGALTPDDHWRIPFNFELCSRETPLRARRSGITADAAGTGLSYYWNETRSFNSTVSYMNFSDDNQRLAVSADVTQRLYTWFNHYIDGTVNSYASWNSENEDRPYYNPKRDFEIGAALTYGTLLWRKYDSSLSHSLTAGLGNYYQRYYGSSRVWSLAYNHAWKLGDRLSLGYGIGYGRGIYDGSAERSLNAHFSAVYRF